MLLQFKVKNFLSIKDEQLFNMEAGNHNEKIENIILDSENNKYLRSAAIYGANASGKSNFIKALTAAILMVRKSNKRDINELLFEMQPFKFDKKLVTKPCEFEFVFLENGTKYIYGFSADKNRIYTEYLYQYLTAKPSLIFERKNTIEYKFPKIENSKLAELKTKNTEKMLFLSTATTWNYEKTRNPYMWFASRIDTYSDYMNMMAAAFSKYENDADCSLKDFTIKLLKAADILIKDYTVDIKEIKTPNSFIPINRDILAESRNMIQKEIKVATIHEIEGDKGKLEKYELNLAEESTGTQNLFFLSPILKDVVVNGKILIIDEIDKSLHPLLVEFIIKLFSNREINKHNAQIIFTTHDTNLLSLELFRRDQIWFAEKNPKKGSTDIYRLDEFSVRKGENIQKGYMNGRYGAIPFIANGEL